jgi:hydroxyacylglutathione hydrolase
MFVKRFFEPSIAQASYMIGCQRTGEAIVIDANRDVDQYVDAAVQEGLRITHVTETHIHADYLSGSRELAQRTGASLCLSDEGDQDWKYQFKHDRKLKEGDRIAIGNIAIDVLHTPGHTPEHLTFLVTDGAAADRPIAAVTGDFLFVGDVGRPDLLERAANIKGTMEKGARVLWNSLQKFAAHDEWLQIWPGHGAGSACGKGISSIPSSTLGYERRFNWAYGIKSEAEFVESVLAGQPEPPKYFATMKRLNRDIGGPEPGGSVHGASYRPTPEEVLATDSPVIDTRPAHEFADSHRHGAINIPLNGSFLTWAGWLIPYDKDFYLFTDREAEVRRLLSLIGLQRVAGVMPTGAARGGGEIRQASAQDVASKLDSLTVVDVRSANEWGSGHIPGAVHIPLGYLADRTRELPTDRPIVVQCQSGGRSSIAASVLARMGFANVTNLSGGITAWAAAGLPIEGGVHETQTPRA